MAPPTGVLLLNMGGPDTLDAIRPFLRNLFSDRDIIRLPGGRVGQWLLARIISRARARKVREKYEAIGGGSPIAALTSAQARALERSLNSDGNREWIVRPAMRYWHPFTGEALREMLDAGVEELVTLSMYPHYTRATTGSSMTELHALLDDEFAGRFSLRSIDRWPTVEGYLDALAGRVSERLGETEAGATVLFTAHGLPVSFIEEGDSYVDDLNATIAGVMSRLPEGTQWRLAYQSRVGPVEWLSPATQDTLVELAREGIRDVVAVPVSFVTDHLETLHEIEIEFTELAKELGFRSFRMTRALNSDPALIAALTELVRRTAESRGGSDG